MSKNKFAITALALATLVTALHAKPIPEFGNSVEFAKEESGLSLGGLKGKATLIIFFQSWCGICNGWAPDLIRQVQASHGNNRGVTLIALKTDGGGVSMARKYMETKGADPALWIIGSDKNGEYYKLVSGGDSLWGYALVDAEGNIAKQGSAGSYRSGSNPKAYILASASALNECGKISPRLPAEKKYQPELSEIVKYAEIGCYGSALACCASPKLKSKYRLEVAELQSDILAIVDTQINDRVKVLEDTTLDGPVRFDAYLELGEIIKPLGSMPSARKAASLISKSKMDPVIQNEIRAMTEFLTLLQKKQKSSERDIPRINGAFQKLAERYPTTKYGGLAASAAL